MRRWKWEKGSSKGRICKDTEENMMSVGDYYEDFNKFSLIRVFWRRTRSLGFTWSDREGHPTL